MFEFQIQKEPPFNNNGLVANQGAEGSVRVFSARFVHPPGNHAQKQPWIQLAQKSNGSKKYISKKCVWRYHERQHLPTKQKMSQKCQKP